GYAIRPLRLLERAAALAAAGLLMWGGWKTDAAGIALLAAVVLSQIVIRPATVAAGESRTRA
ncbi:MAG TPA: hypothetical protein VM491_00335, partial [Burkholderiaceae bacterium]|nr:hypothetical protein [Burkholderiaceae bacterium]